MLHIVSRSSILFRPLFIIAVFFIWLPVLLGCATGGNKPPTAMSIEELHAYCSLPLPCDTKEIQWEGEEVRIQAFIDPANIFDKKHYPQLPYEKFRLVDRQGRSIEVWPKAPDNRMIFAKIESRALDLVIVRGRLASYKAPIQGQCNLGAKLLIDDASQIEY